MPYTAMWNVPGCLPEMEPVEFDTLAEARVFLSCEIDRAIDELPEQDQAAAERALASFDNEDTADTFYLCGYVYTARELAD